MLNTSHILEALPEGTEATKPISPDYVAKNILFIVEQDHSGSVEYSKENFLVNYSTIDKACALNNPESKFLLFPDIILVSSELENYTDAYLSGLKDFAKERNIPFILYSEKFDRISRNIAAEFGFDDYYTGKISETFQKKADFIKRLKEYKNNRSRSYQLNTRPEQPKVKMWLLKRQFDIIVSATLLFILSPILLLIALIIKLESKGPVFYISKRAGNGYKIFDFYKFRTMRQNADKELQTLSHMNQYGNAVFFKIKNDPRVTRLGNFLRNTSLDELPQLINVLKGDMSLVGNRPLPLYEAEKLTKDQIAWRFLAPAGITGLWQVTKRGKENMSEEERIQLDMQYAMNSSFFYDLKILFDTIPALLQKEAV